MATASQPRPAPSHYATPNYELTFAVPRGATYCPLPRRWVGSDHGTILFLERPRWCGDAGYPSSSRGFEPEAVSRIEVYYGFALDDDTLPPPCHRVATMVFLGRAVPICEAREHGAIVRSVRGTYMSGSNAEAVLTLVSRPSRLARDMAVFQALAKSLRTCNGGWRKPDGSAIGKRPACPKGVRWF